MLYVTFSASTLCRDPNGKALPVWPEYTSQDPQYIEFRGVPADFWINTGLRKNYCQLWDEIGAKINRGEPVR